MKANLMTQRPDLNTALNVLCIFSLTLIVYLVCTPGTVVFEDDGLFILSSYFNGISHPPGYPLYTLLGHIFTWLPVGSTAFRVHSLSAVLGALSCVALWFFARQLLPGYLYASVAAVTFGFSRVFWSQAIIAEVYTLNVLLFVLLLILTTSWYRVLTSGGECRYLPCLIAFIYGLGLSNHWPLLVLSTPALIILLLPVWRKCLYYAPRALPFLLAGMLPYAWMVLHSQSDPLISFYGPIDSISDFWFYISRSGYEAADQNPGAGWLDKLQFSVFIFRESAHQFGILGLLLVLVGLVAQWWVLEHRFCWALIFIYLGSTFALILLLGFNYDRLHISIFRVYPLLSYLAMSIWLATGVYWISTHIKRYKLDPEYFSLVTGLMVILTIMIGNFPVNYRAKDNFAEQYAKIILDSLPLNAYFFLNGDNYVGPIGYMNLVEKYRPDITLNHVYGRLFENRLVKPNKTTLFQARKTYDLFINKSESEIFYTFDLPHSYDVQDYGLYFKVIKNQKNGSKQFLLMPEMRKLAALEYPTGQFIDSWNAMVINRTKLQYCRILFNLVISNKMDKNQYHFVRNEINKNCLTHEAKNVFLDIALTQDKLNMEELGKLYNLNPAAQAFFITREEEATYYYYLGEVESIMNNEETARKYYLKSVDLMNTHDNPAIERLSDK